MKTKFYKLDNYTMKCRLYPNKNQAQAIDDAIYAVQCYHNCALWDIYTNHMATTEKPYVPKKDNVEENSESQSSPSVKPGDPIHFVNKNLKEVFTKEYKSALTKEHPIIEKAPAAAITTNVGLKDDMIRAFDFKNNKKPIEFREKPKFYNKSHPRRSYTYQESFGKLSLTDNKNVLYINLAKIGRVKLRGWNQKIRFDESATVDFATMAQQQKNEKVTVTVSKDSSGDYWICFKLKYAYKEMSENPEGQIGIDVGLKEIAITSDNVRYENKHFKRKAAKRHRKLNRKLSRRQGWANIKFRTKHKENPELTVSKRYLRTKKALSNLDRKTARQREQWNHQISKELIEKNGYIAVESLNVKGMFQNRHLANALSDAGLYQLLLMLEYKSSWYNRKIQPIDKWMPSSKRCSCCKFYFHSNLTLNIRHWVCPNCGAKHDRDLNAAKNILDYALKITSDNPS